MTVEELIAELQKMPPDTQVRSVDSDCCGCGWSDGMHVELDDDGEHINVYADQRPETTGSEEPK